METPRKEEPGSVGSTERAEERVWRAGREEPLPIKELPDAPASVHIIGPAMVLVALGVGLGETFLWPRLVLLFGPEIRWLFLIGVSLQTVVMLEMARYAMATGESIFFGAARIWKPIMWFFFVTAALVYIWPGHISAGAVAFEQIFGVPWLISAIVGLILIGVVFSLAKFVYNLLESLLTFLIGVLVVGSSIIAAMVGSMSDLGSTITGLFAFGYFPSEIMTATWFPVLVGSIAFAGPSGMQQMWYTLWLRDKGAGMGVHIPRIRGLVHADEEETMPSRGYMFDTENPDEMRKWAGWRRWVMYDALLLFFGITMLVTIVYTVLAQAATKIDPGVTDALRAGEEDAAIQGMAAAFSSAGGAILGTAFFFFIALVGWKGSLGIFDAFARGQADMTHYFIPGMRRFNMSYIYFAFLWGVIAFGILILLFGPADGPTAMLDILAFLSTFAMGTYCLLLVLTNNMLLPKKIRPNIVISIVLVLGGLFYLGMLAYSLVRFGIVVG